MSIDKFALVIGDKFLVAEYGERFVGKLGICRVTDGVSETQIVPAYMSAALLEGYSVSPSFADYPTALLPLHAELEAVRLIRQEAAKVAQIESAVIPAFFHRLNAMESGLLTMSLSDTEVSFSMAKSLIDRLALRDGDRLSLAASNDGSEFCLYYDKSGNDISQEKGEELQVTYYIPSSYFGLSDGIAGFSLQIQLPFELREQRVHFLKADVTRMLSFRSQEEAAGRTNDRIVATLPLGGRRQVIERLRFMDRLSMAVGDWGLYLPFG